MFLIENSLPYLLILGLRYIQIDSHVTFLQDWDTTSIEMLKNALTKKAVISRYLPPHTADLVKKSVKPAPRLCGPVFATSDLESQIIRLEGLAVSCIILRIPISLSTALFNDQLFFSIREFSGL